MSESADNRRLEEELVRLRAENKELRACFRVDPPEPEDAWIVAEDPREVRVLLLPDPLRKVKPGEMGPQTIANVARVLINAMKERQPNVDWRAEHDLDQIPEDAQCFQLGEVGSRLMTGAGPWPKTFRIDRSEEADSKIRRCLVADEPDTERYLVGYGRLSQVFDDLVAEGKAAFAADEQHHAGWVLKALDLVLAQMNLARVNFESGRGDWREVLERPRPEYDPRRLL